MPDRSRNSRLRSGGSEGRRHDCSEARTHEAKTDNRHSRLGQQQRHRQAQRREQRSSPYQSRCTEPGVEPVSAQSRRRHADSESRHGQAGRRLGSADRAFHVQAAPVVGGAFRHESDQRESAQENEGATWSPQSARFDVSIGSQRQPQHQGRGQEQRRLDGELGERSYPGRYDLGADNRSDELADAPAAVELGHDRPRTGPLDGDAVGIHADVHGSLAHSEQQQAQGEAWIVPGPAHERQHYGHAGEGE